MRGKMSKIENSEDWRFDKNAKSYSYFSNKNDVVINKELIEELKITVQRNRENIRVCLHKNTEDTLHDMIIYQYQNKICRKPHRHYRKNDTLQVLEGKLIVFIFTENGELMNKVALEPHKTFMIRIPTNIFHLYLPETKTILYRETKQGPFERNDNEYPSWNHIEALKKYVHFMDLTCFNASCKKPCGLNDKL